MRLRTYVYVICLFFFVKLTTMFRLFCSMQIPLISRPFCRKKEIKSQIRRKGFHNLLSKLHSRMGRSYQEEASNAKQFAQIAMTLHFKQFGTELWFAFTEVVCAKILFKVPSHLTRLLPQTSPLGGISFAITVGWVTIQQFA